MPAATSLGAPAGRLWEETRVRRELIPLAAIVAVAAAVRFLGLGHQSFDSGETVTAARILHPSYAATFHAYSTIERSGPLYYTLAWAWAHLFGTGEVALRSLSAIFGLATVPIVFLCAREILSRRAALAAAALAAVCPDLIWYSQEARSYPLFIMLTAAALYFSVRTLRRPSRASYAGWAACSALSLCTHYFAIFSVGPEALWLIWVNRRAPRCAIVATGAIGAVGLALLPLAIHQEGSGRANAFTAIPVLERAASSLVKFTTGEGPATAGSWATLPPLFRTVGVLALALASAAVLTVAWRGKTGERRAAAIIGGVGAFALCFPLVLALAGIDYVEPRNLLGSLVPLLIVMAAGIDVAIRALARGGAQPGGWFVPAAVPIFLFAAVIAATWLYSPLQRYDWRAVSHLVAATPRAGVILAEPPSAAKPLHYFLGKPLAPLVAAHFPCGVRSRTIVTISRHGPRPDPGYGFRRISSHRTAQGWIVDSFAAASPQPLDGAGVRALEILGPLATARVDHAVPATPRTLAPAPVLLGTWRRGLRGRPAVRGGRPARAHPTRGMALTDPPGWPPPKCPFANSVPFERAEIAAARTARLRPRIATASRRARHRRLARGLPPGARARARSA
jgi:mannosyltransferase